MPEADRQRLQSERVAFSDAANVIAFPRRGGRATRPPLPGTHEANPLPVETFAPYEGGEDEDYRHRMAINVVVFLLCIALVGSGLWLADTIAKLRRDQDCVLSGRPNCANISIARKLPQP
ncbi:MAG: hypothetical protein AB7K64_07995 [Variibacter sp.]